MASTLGSDTTHDAFLGGRLMLEQPSKGYRAGVDPVLLAAAVPARGGDSVLELGCGTGAALLCLGTRVAGLDLYGVEMQFAYAELCRANAAANAIPATIWTADLRAPPAALRALSFDHVIANPPFYDRATGSQSGQPDRDIAFGGDTPMADWIEAATRRLKPKGRFTLIQKADRLRDVLASMDSRLGSIVIHPIAARTGRDADRVLIMARKGGGAALRLCAPVVLHAGASHLRDSQDYAPAIRAVLRDGAAFPLDD